MHYSGTPKGQVLYHGTFDPQNSRLLFSFFPIYTVRSTHWSRKKFVIIIVMSSGMLTPALQRRPCVCLTKKVAQMALCVSHADITTRIMIIIIVRGS